MKYFTALSVLALLFSVEQNVQAHRIRNKVRTISQHRDVEDIEIALNAVNDDEAVV